jgi:hypothetical protein
VFEQPLTEVAARAGIDFWLPEDASPETWRAEQAKVRDAIETLASALRIPVLFTD